MPFHSQFGRFGDVVSGPLGGTDPDQHAADTLAGNGTSLNPRPNRSNVLARKGFLEQTDASWLGWASHFSGLISIHIGSSGRRLSSVCTRNWPGYTAGQCLHELTPPLHHGSLRWFCKQVANLPDNLLTRADGSLGIDPAVKPTWIFVIAEEGEIVTGQEDFGVIKHSCLAGGLEIWSAGQLGIENGLLRLVDLSSGHYVRPRFLQGSPSTGNLIRFTRDVFLDYAKAFDMTCIHSQFDCIWG